MLFCLANVLRLFYLGKTRLVYTADCSRPVPKKAGAAYWRPARIARSVRARQFLLAHRAFMAFRIFALNPRRFHRETQFAAPIRAIFARNFGSAHSLFRRVGCLLVRFRLFISTFLLHPGTAARPYWKAVWEGKLKNQASYQGLLIGMGQGRSWLIACQVCSAQHGKSYGGNPFDCQG